MKTLYRLFAMIGILWLLAANSSQAQCPMCRMSAEADLKNGGNTTRGLNKGILYLLTMPYFMIGGVGFLWWRSQKRAAEDEQDDELRSLLEPLD